MSLFEELLRRYPVLRPYENEIEEFFDLVSMVNIVGFHTPVKVQYAGYFVIEQSKTPLGDIFDIKTDILHDAKELKIFTNTFYGQEPYKKGYRYNLIQRIFKMLNALFVKRKMVVFAPIQSTYMPENIIARLEYIKERHGRLNMIARKPFLFVSEKELYFINPFTTKEKKVPKDMIKYISINRIYDAYNRWRKQNGNKNC